MPNKVRIQGGNNCQQEALKLPSLNWAKPVGPVWPVWDNVPGQHQFFFLKLYNNKEVGHWSGFRHSLLKITLELWKFRYFSCLRRIFGRSGGVIGGYFAIDDATQRPLQLCKRLYAVYPPLYGAIIANFGTIPTSFYINIFANKRSWILIYSNVDSPQLTLFRNQKPLGLEGLRISIN
jgi:hypothetical protein